MEPDLDLDPRLSRRRFIQASLVAAAAAAAPGVAGAANAPNPKRGGTLRTAQVGGGTAETLNPFASTNFIAAARSRQLYNTLMRPSEKQAGVFVPELAESVEPNK